MCIYKRPTSFGCFRRQDSCLNFQRPPWSTNDAKKIVTATRRQKKREVMLPPQLRPPHLIPNALDMKLRILMRSDSVSSAKTLNLKRVGKREYVSISINRPRERV